jgi:hypothetical protein
MACEDPTIAIDAKMFCLFIFISICGGFDKKK